MRRTSIDSIHLHLKLVQAPMGVPGPLRWNSTPAYIAILPKNHHQKSATFSAEKLEKGCYPAGPAPITATDCTQNMGSNCSHCGNAGLLSSGGCEKRHLFCNLLPHTNFAISFHTTNEDNHEVVTQQGICTAPVWIDATSAE